MRPLAAAAAGALLACSFSPAAARPQAEKHLRKTVTKCPEHTTPVRTVDSREPWACSLKDEKYRDGIECPRGSRAVTTPNIYDPFKCALKDIRLVAPRGMCRPGHRAVPTSDPDKDFDCEEIGKGFKGGPRCPKGTRPVPTPEALQPFACIAESFKQKDTEPTLDPSFDKTKPAPKPREHCPRGTRKVETGDPFSPVRCVAADKARPARLRYVPYRIGGEISFKRPQDWKLNDAWRQIPPSVHMTPETARDGKPVYLSIVRERAGRPDFVDLETRIWQEMEWHGAVEKDRGVLGGRKVVHLEVPAQSAMALIALPDGYFVLSYSAPAELYAHFQPAYDMLLKSFKPLEFKRPK